MVDSVRRSPGKRKGEGDQPNPRPAKRPTCWVAVPPRRKRALSVSVKQEQSSPEAAEVEDATVVPKQEPDQEASNALSIIRNVSLAFPPTTPQSVTSPVFFFFRQTGIKPDKESMDDVSVFTRLSRVGLEIFPITIEDKVKVLSVSRQGFLSKHFGGSSVSTHPKISKKNLRKHGFDNFMYIPLVSAIVQEQ